MGDRMLGRMGESGQPPLGVILAGGQGRRIGGEQGDASSWPDGRCLQ